MKTEEKLKSVKRYGARYGRKLKLKLSKIEEEQRKLHKCPYCNKLAVKRIAVGIWNCAKCKAKFTGKAYSISKQILTTEGQIETENTEEQIPAEEESYEEESEQKADNETDQEADQDTGQGQISEEGEQ